MDDESKVTIKKARKTLKYYIDFLERILKDLNTNDEQRITRAVLAITCIHLYFTDHFKVDMEQMIQNYLSSRTH